MQGYLGHTKYGSVKDIHITDEVHTMDRVTLLRVRKTHNRARKSRTTPQNKVRLKVLPEQLTLFVNTSVTFKKCIIQ